MTQPRKGQSSRGTVSDEAVIAKTGHPLAHWFEVLDRFDAREKGHTAAARHLADDHGVSAWYAQGITVAWERKNGLRAANQRTDGSWEVSVSRVVPVPIDQVVEALQKKARRKQWLAEADPELAQVVESWLSQPDAVRIKDEARALGRTRWEGAIDLRVTSSTPGKTTVAIQHRGIATEADMQLRRTGWKTVIDGLKRHLS